MSLREVVETYMLGSRSGLDGILHGALNVEDPRVRLDSRADNWMSTKHQSKETLIESNER